MGNKSRPAAPADRAESATENGRRGDLILRVLMLIGFIAFAVTTVWNLQQIRDDLRARDEQRRDHLFWVLSRPGTTSEDRTEAFKHLVAIGNTEWRAAELKNLKLKEANLNGAKLKYAWFDACDFEGAGMANVELSPGSLSTCNLTEVNFDHADLRETRIFKCTGRKTNFTLAKLLRTSLEQSTFEEAEFATADMTEAVLLQTIFRDCNLKGANLTGADLTDAKFVRTDLLGVNLSRTRLNNTDFTDSNWWTARGLSSEAIKEYSRLFPPSQNAPKKFQEDYLLWQKTGTP